MATPQSFTMASWPAKPTDFRVDPRRTAKVTHYIPAHIRQI